MFDQQMLISDCLMKFGYVELSKMARDPERHGVSHDLTTLVVREAEQRQDVEILERLHFSALIYG